MPEQAAPPPVEDDLMYSSPPPPHTLGWFAQRSLDALGRLLLGALICTLAVGITIAFIVLLFFGTSGLLHLLSLLWPFH